MKADPLLIVISECRFEGPTGPLTYDVTLGEYGDTLYDGACRKEALAAAYAKIAELGLPRTAIRFRCTAVNDLSLENSRPTPSISTMRRRADKLGYRLVKARGERLPDNHGGYMLTTIDTGGSVLGHAYDADLYDVFEFLDREAA
jgi:hypothetical protein